MTQLRFFVTFMIKTRFWGKRAQTGANTLAFRAQTPLSASVVMPLRSSCSYFRIFETMLCLAALPGKRTSSSRSMDPK